MTFFTSIRSIPQSGRRFLHGTMLLGAALLVMFAVPAPAGDGVDVDLNVTNDEIAPIFVTIYDGSAGRPLTAVMQHARISGFSSLPISVSPDAAGRANVSWTAISVGAGNLKCGHGAMNDLTNNASVKVQVDSDCAG